MPDTQAQATCSSRKLTAGQEHLPAFFLASLLAFSLAALSPVAAADNALLITGYTSDSAVTATNQDAELAAALLQLGITSESGWFSDSAIGHVAKARNNFSAAVSSMADGQSIAPFAQLYLPCMMILATHAGGSGIRIPENAGAVFLERWDQNTGEAFSAVLAATASDSGAPDSAPHRAPAWLQPSGQTETILGYQAVGYSGTPADQGMVVPPETAGPTLSPATPEPDGYNIAVAVEFQQNFTAWIATEVAGADIARQFLHNLHLRLPPEQQLHPLFQGRLQRQTGILELGLPLHVIESQHSKIGGSVVSTTTKESMVTDIRIIEAQQKLCSQSFIPADFQQTAER